MEVYLAGNPATLEDGECPNYHSEILDVLPDIEIVDGVRKISCWICIGFFYYPCYLFGSSIGQECKVTNLDFGQDLPVRLFSIVFASEVSMSIWWKRRIRVNLLISVDSLKDFFFHFLHIHFSRLMWRNLQGKVLLLLLSWDLCQHQVVSIFHISEKKRRTIRIEAQLIDKITSTFKTGSHHWSRNFNHTFTQFLL